MALTGVAENSLPVVAAVVLLCAWVIVPLYFLLINTLSAPDTVNSYPKSFLPEFDLGSLVGVLREGEREGDIYEVGGEHGMSEEEYWQAHP